MLLFEAIVDANHRALAGDTKAGLHPADFSSSLPIAALTCIDARLNPLFPEVLGVPKEQFIWLRNAGNIITGTTSSTLRSLALACAVKGAREIVIIGHNDCQVCKTSTMKLTDAFRALGVERSSLPENLTEFFGMFASERQNVIKGTDFVRRSPLIGPRIPVHGLLVDIETGKLEWVVNGYQTLESEVASPLQSTIHSAQPAWDTMKALEDFKLGEMKFPETRIGEAVAKAADWVSTELKQFETKSQEAVPPEPPPVVRPRRIPLPPQIRPSPNVKKWNK
jgi:carbonic anhydrase